MPHYSFLILIPANTTQSSPYTQILKLHKGVIHDIEIIVPPGHAGLAHLRLSLHEHQLYPLSPGENYHGDDILISFKDFQPLQPEPYELKATAWNLDDTFDHRFIVNVGILPAVVLIPQLLTQTAKKVWDVLIGKTIEVK